MTPKTLVAGIGNVFLSDDGFGVEVAARLAHTDLPDGVKVVDYGIRGMHLAYDLASGYDAAILVDATPRGGAPGTIYVIEPDLGRTAARADGNGTGYASPGDASAGDAVDAAPAANPLLDAHGMQPDVVFGMLDMLGGDPPERILIVGCEPASIEYGMGLSDRVSASVDEAVRVVIDLAAAGCTPQEPDKKPVAGAQASGGQSELSTEGWTHVPRHSR